MTEVGVWDLLQTWRLARVDKQVTSCKICPADQYFKRFICYLYEEGSQESFDVEFLGIRTLVKPFESYFCGSCFQHNFCKMAGVSQAPPFPPPEGKVQIRFYTSYIRQLRSSQDFSVSCNQRMFYKKNDI